MRKILLTTVFVMMAWFSQIQAQGQTWNEYYLSGASDLQKGSHISAVENLTLALNSRGRDYRILMKRGEARYHLGEYDPAILDFTAANSLQSGVADLWLAKCYAETGEEGIAISFLERHLKSDYRLPTDRITGDPAFDALQITEDWFILWQGDWYTPAEEVVSEATYLLKKGLMEDAIRTVESAIARGIDDAGIHAMRGRIHMEEGSFGTAVSDFTAAIERNGDNAQLYFDRASANVGAGRYREAVSDLNRVLRDEPALFEGYLLRAEAYAGMNSWDLAIEDANTYLKYFGTDQRAIFLCGDYHFHKGEFLKALEYFNQNMKDDPQNAIYMKARGKAFTMTRTYRYAIYDLTMSLDLDPSDGETWLYLGIAEMQTGNHEAACSDFEQARRMGDPRALEYIVDNCQ